MTTLKSISTLLILFILSLIIVSCGGGNGGGGGSPTPNSDNGSQCPSGQTRNSSGQCVTQVTQCPSGQTRNSSGQCVTQVTQCPSGQTRNSSGQCVTQVTQCPSGQTRNSSGQCVTQVTQCPSGQTRNSSGQCVTQVTQCPSGQTRNSSGQCVTQVTQCPSGQTRNSSGQCVTQVTPPPVTPNTQLSINFTNRDGSNAGGVERSEEFHIICAECVIPGELELDADDFTATASTQIVGKLDGHVSFGGPNINAVWYIDLDSSANALMIFNNVAITNGDPVSNVPVGRYTYNGSNFMTSPDSPFIDAGSFSMSINFSNETGSISGTTNDPNNRTSSRISGNFNVDTSNGTFSGNNLTFTRYFTYLTNTLS